MFGLETSIQFLFLEDSVDRPDIDPNNAVVRFVDVTERTLVQNSTIFSQSVWCQGCSPNRLVSLHAHHQKHPPPQVQYLTYAPNEYVNVGVVAWPIMFTVSPSGEVFEHQLGYFARYTVCAKDLFRKN